MNMDILAVDTSTLTVYDFLGDGETEQELLQRAYNSNTRNIAHYEAIIAENLHGSLFPPGFLPAGTG